MHHAQLNYFKNVKISVPFNNSCTHDCGALYTHRDLIWVNPLLTAQHQNSLLHYLCPLHLSQLHCKPKATPGLALQPHTPRTSAFWYPLYLLGEGRKHWGLQSFDSQRHPHLRQESFSTRHPVRARRQSFSVLSPRCFLTTVSSADNRDGDGALLDSPGSWAESSLFQC